MKRGIHLLTAAIGIVALMVAGCANPTADTPAATPSAGASGPAASADADLSELKISAGTLSPAFDKGITEYAVSVPYETESITITGTKANANAGVSANNGAAQSLSVGANAITIAVTAQDGKAKKNYAVTVTRASSAGSTDPSNADLSTLAVSAGTLTPAFSPSVTSYAVSVPYETESVTVTGTNANANASLSANNGAAQSLSVGTNDIVITVTSQDGKAIKNYAVTVTRAGQAGSANANLSALTVITGSGAHPLSPSFSKDVTSYAVSVPNGYSSCNIVAKAADSGAKVSASVAMPMSLSVGANPITFTVTAADGKTVKEYALTVNRVGASDADLSSLTVSERVYVPTFAKGITAYTVRVSNATTSIAITGKTADPNASVSANNGVPQTLNVGENPIAITVTAEDGTTKKDYVVTVIRLSTFTLSMVSVPAGAFQRDGTATNTSAVSGFRISDKEISRDQFLSLMGGDPMTLVYSMSSGTSDPATKITWYQAIAFCNKLSIQEGLTPVYGVSGVNFAALTNADIPTAKTPAWEAATANWENDGYRLPTRMEWLWAAMGAPADGQNGGVNKTGYLKKFAGSTGANDIRDYAWIKENYLGKLHPVGVKLANELGLYDMSGNAEEWCWDYYAPDPRGAVSDYRGEATSSSGMRRLSGGYIMMSTNESSIFIYGGCEAYTSHGAAGFRVARR